MNRSSRSTRYSFALLGGLSLAGIGFTMITVLSGHERLAVVGCAIGALGWIAVSVFWTAAGRWWWILAAALVCGTLFPLLAGYTPVQSTARMAMGISLFFAPLFMGAIVLLRYGLRVR